MESRTDDSTAIRFSWFRLAALSLAGLALALAAGGCSHSQDKDAREAARTGIYSAPFPAFLNGPMAVLLTNSGGFSARAMVQTEPAAAPEEGARPGQLFCRGSRLLYVPDPSESTEKGAHSGGFSFIWDTAENRGYVLSEALQGYAPVASNVQATNIVAQANQAAPRKFAGHSCVPEDATVLMSDGSTTVFQVLRATDLKGLPVRVISVTRNAPLTLNLSKIRLEPPPNDLFAPPDSFTRYNSPEVMVDELAIREHNLKHKTREETGPIEEPTPGRERR
jgi:hypothetical protein